MKCIQPGYCIVRVKAVVVTLPDVVVTGPDLVTVAQERLTGPKLNKYRETMPKPIAQYIKEPRSQSQSRGCEVTGCCAETESTNSVPHSRQWADSILFSRPQ